jgi:hypothetical protein
MSHNPGAWIPPNWQNGIPAGQAVIWGARNTGKSTLMTSAWLQQYRHQLDLQAREEQLMKIRQVGNEWHVIVENFAEKVEWCRETLGEGGASGKYRWHAKWLDLTYFNNNSLMRDTLTLKFRDKEGIAMFKLRWL